MKNVKLIVVTKGEKRKINGVGGKPGEGIAPGNHTHWHTSNFAHPANEFQPNATNYLYYRHFDTYRENRRQQKI